MKSELSPEVRQSKSPLLSVVIPVYNVEKYLRECLDSVVNQTYKNLEIIIVNDCSPDNSEAIILEYAEKDDRIVYIKHEVNTFQGGARNTGIDRATGEYITFVDSDDYLELNAYEIVVQKMIDTDVDFCMFGTICFDEQTKKEFSRADLNSDLPNVFQITNKNFNFMRTSHSCNKIFKTAGVKDIIYPENIKYEDTAFWFKYQAYIKPKGVGISKGLYHYRNHDLASTSNHNSKNRVDFGYVVENIYDFLKYKNILDDYRDDLLKFADRWCIFNDDHGIQIDTNIKLLSLMKKFTNHFNDKELFPYKKLFYLKNINEVNEYTIDFYNELNNEYSALNDMNITRRVRRLVKIEAKRILKRLGLFDAVKKLMGRK